MWLDIVSCRNGETRYYLEGKRVATDDAKYMLRRNCGLIINRRKPWKR